MTDKKEKTKEKHEQDDKYDNYFYENKVPQKDELVMCRVIDIDEMGVICSLLEYNNAEGFLPLSEISRKRIRSVLRHVRVGQKQVLQVLRVDTERGFTDLSKKYITPVERDHGTEKYIKGKNVHSIAKHIATIQKKDLDEIKKSIIYPLDQKFDHPYDAFQNLSLKDEDIFEGLDVDISTELRQELISIVKKRMSTHPVKVGADIQVSCYADGGIDEIKKALKCGIEFGKGDKVSIQLVSSPTYSIWMTTIDEKRGKQIIEKVIGVIRDSINSSHGSLTVSKEPSLIGKNENKFETRVPEEEEVD
jgi:translation initiation factor 2 subunit 1